MVLRDRFQGESQMSTGASRQKSGRSGFVLWFAGPANTCSRWQGAKRPAVMGVNI
jgi:hypothetical protein